MVPPLYGFGNCSLPSWVLRSLAQAGVKHKTSGIKPLEDKLDMRNPPHLPQTGLHLILRLT
jgi:hypothetical protein